MRSKLKPAVDNVRITAYHIAENVNLRQFKSDFTGELISSTSSDLFYKVGDGGLFYIFNYGLAAFAGISEVETSRIISLVKEYSQNPRQEAISDDYYIKKSNEKEPTFDFDFLIVPNVSQEVVKITMFNLAQSVALDYYAHIADELLEEVNRFTLMLEKTGRIKFSKKNMLKFVGRTLNIKNKIIDNLYIFDVPEPVWENKYFDKIHTGLVRTFDLNSRFKEVQSSFQNIEDNLGIFMEVYQHRMSNILEWIIILLILIEVVDLFITKIFNG